VRIAVSGYYGFGNIGDEAVFLALKQNLNNHQLVVLPANRRAWLSLFWQLWRCDLLISGGGTLFQDKTSSASLWYYLMIILLAKLFRKPVAIIGQGIGPLVGPFNIFLAKQILRRVDLITVRDQSSHQLIMSPAWQLTNTALTADLALTLQLPDKTMGRKILGELGLPLDRTLIGVAIRAADFDRQFLGRLAQQLDQLAVDQQAALVFLPFQLPADKAISQRVMALMKTKSYLLAHPYKATAYSPLEMLSVMANLSGLVGMRLHALVFGALARLPLFALNYDPKVAALADQFRLPSATINDSDFKIVLAKPQGVAEEVVKAQNNFVLLRKLVA